MANHPKSEYQQQQRNEEKQEKKSGFLRKLSPRTRSSNSNCGHLLRHTLSLVVPIKMMVDHECLLLIVRHLKRDGWAGWKPKWRIDSFLELTLGWGRKWLVSRNEKISSVRKTCVLVRERNYVTFELIHETSASVESLPSRFSKAVQWGQSGYESWAVR